MRIVKLDVTLQQQLIDVTKCHLRLCHCPNNEICADYIFSTLKLQVETGTCLELFDILNWEQSDRLLFPSGPGWSRRIIEFDSAGVTSKFLTSLFLHG